MILGYLNSKCGFITTAWDGTNPTINICLEEDRGTLPGTAPTAETTIDATDVQTDVTPNTTGSIFSGVGGNLFTTIGDALCVTATGLYVYVDDSAGADPGSSQGEGELHIFICRVAP